MGIYMGSWAHTCLEPREDPGRFYKPALEHLKQQHKHFPKSLSSKTIVGENRDLLWKKEVDELKQTLIAEITRERLRRRQVRVSKDKTQQ